nr:LysR substrate-binding domain-containing protein [Sinorhizobium mexicanum]
MVDTKVVGFRGRGGFDPKTSTRLFQVTTVDYVAALLAPALRAALADEAPGVRFSLRFGTGQAALDHVRTDDVDLAIGRFDLLPDGYRASSLSEDSYSVVMRKGHVFAEQPDLERYLEAEHLLVSFSGEHYGSADRALLTAGRKRRVVASVPLFMAALSTVANTDLFLPFPRGWQILMRAPSIWKRSRRRSRWRRSVSMS